MTKRSRFYQIGFFTLAIAFIALCLFVGITAIQKQMKLNLAVKMNPSIVCEIQASMDGVNGTYNKIFSNVEGSTSIGTNWSISGNTLSYNTSSTDMGKEIYLKVTNKTTGTRVMVEYNNEVKDVIEVNGTSTTPFSVSIPGNGKVQMLFSQVFKVTTTLTHASITATTNLYEIGGTYYAKTGTTPTMTLTSDTHYTNPPSSVEVTGATKGYTNGVLTLSNITGDVTVTASASAATYTVSSNLSGISSNTIANKATYNTNYTFTLTVASTSWTIGTVTYTVGGGSAQTLTDTTTDNLTYTYTIPGNKITGAIVINATATSSYSIYATINGEDVLIGDYSPKSASQVEDITYPSTFTYAGDLMSAVTGVSEVTATQITIAANMTGDITIVPKGYTIGTYTDDSTDVAYNAAYSVENLKATEIYYSPFVGYKYIQFNGAESYDDSGTLRHLRWIIIGAGSSVSNATMLGAVQNTVVTSYAFSGTLTNAKYSNTGKNSELGESQVLLLSEQVVDAMYYGSYYGLWTHAKSTTRIFLNGDFYTNSGLSSYESCIDTPKLKTAWRYQSDTSYGATYNSQECVEDEGSKIFVLATRNGYFSSGTSAANGIHVTNTNTSYQTVKFGYQNYCVEDYLGTSDATFKFQVPSPGESFSGGNCEYGNEKLASFSGASTSHWWLRSGDCDRHDLAYSVYSNGYVNDYTVVSDRGVRPSFVFNLA